MKIARSVVCTLLSCCCLWTTGKEVYYRPDSEEANDTVPTLEPALEEDHDVKYVLGTAGSNTELPCDLPPAQKGDDLLLVLWYKIGQSSPVYTLDLRSGGISPGKHYADKTMFDEPTRAVMRIHPRPPALVLRHLIAGDAGLFRCRMDFRVSPTRQILVNLTVVGPLQPPRIRNELGHRVGDVIGPIPAGGQLVATCSSAGGIPEPMLVWSWGNKTLDQQYEILKGHAVNTVRVLRVNRADHGEKLICSASHSYHRYIVQSTVSLFVANPPDKVLLRDKTRDIIAGVEYEFTCTAVNSSGPTAFRWLLNNRELFNHVQLETSTEDLWVSSIRYRPVREDHGSVLICSVLNEVYPGVLTEDSVTLDIKYPPHVLVQFGRNINAGRVEAGDDVYFQCNVDSNPHNYNLTWRHNGKFLEEDIAQGIIFSNQSLALQRVNRESTGLYTCIASNPVGDGESNALHLDVKSAPVCEFTNPKIREAELGGSVRLKCQIYSNPVPEHFHWRVSHTSAFNRTTFIYASNSVQNHTGEELLYKIYTENDYRTIGCTSERRTQNLDGYCLFIIRPPTSSVRMISCETHNVTYKSIHLRCKHPPDKGRGSVDSEDLFTGVITLNGDTLQRKQLSGGRLDFNDLDPDLTYTITVYRWGNTGGKQLVLNTSVATMKLPGHQLGQLASKVSEAKEFPQKSYFDTPTLLGIALGVCGTILVSVLVILAGLKCISKRRGQAEPVGVPGIDKAQVGVDAGVRQPDGGRVPGQPRQREVDLPHRQVEEQNSGQLGSTSCLYRSDNNHQIIHVPISIPPDSATGVGNQPEPLDNRRFYTFVPPTSSGRIRETILL